MSDPRPAAYARRDAAKARLRDRRAAAWSRVRGPGPLRLRAKLCVNLLAGYVGSYWRTPVGWVRYSPTIWWANLRIWVAKRGSK